MHKNIGWFIRTYISGAMIGAADLVPGVSGGTIAFLLGIYDRLITAIKVGSSFYVWMILLKGNFKVFYKAVDASFMLILVLGALTSVLLGASLLHSLIIEQTIALLAFFIGLTVAAACLIASKLPIKLEVLVFILLGFLLSLAVALADPVVLSTQPPLQGFFLAGMIALCAMILPGISGSFVLLLLGIYPFLIEAIHFRSITIIVVFAAGGISGLALFARLLRFLLVKYHNATVALLVGIMLGAIPKLWPWKEAAEGIKVILQPSVWPSTLENPSYLIATVGLMLGILSIVATEAFSKYQKNGKNTSFNEETNS